jgi:hypothetical protein
VTSTTTMIHSMDTRKSPDNESLRLELQEALITFRHWTTQGNQAAGVVATGDVLLITYGFSQKLAGVLFLASVLPLAILLGYLQIMSAAAPIIILAMRLERRLSIRDVSLAATYAKTHLRPLTSRFPSIDSLNDGELIDLSQCLSMRYWLRKQVPIVLYAATAIQIGLAILSLTVYGFKFI